MGVDVTSFKQGRSVPLGKVARERGANWARRPGPRGEEVSPAKSNVGRAMKWVQEESEENPWRAKREKRTDQKSRQRDKGG